jgi:hypothetical protein
VGDIGNEGEQKEEDMLINHELAQEFDASGNSADA